MLKKTGLTVLAVTGALLAALPATAKEKPSIVHKAGNANSPIASSVSVPAAANLVYLSGSTASPLDPAKPEDLGDTRAQTLSILTKMKASLAEMGLTMGDIVKMNIFMVGVPDKDGHMDSAAMNEVFRTFFGTAEQPNKPARSTVQVAALGRPNIFIEIEAIAAKMP